MLEGEKAEENWKQEVDEKQRASHFHADKEALMNLNQCPVGIYHEGKTRMEQIGV